jgi:hypothetical protein
MVVSHAVIAPLDEAISEADLRPLLALLIKSPAVPSTLAACEVSRLTEMPAMAVDLAAAAEALTTRGVGPVVRIGHEGFEALVVSLWSHLWPEVRARFAFRLSFGPQDLVDVPKPSLVCTPASLAARWIGYRIVGSAGPKAISRAAEILSGGAGAEPVLRFAREIGARVNDLTELPLLERAHELASALMPTFDECVGVLRLVERLSPEPTTGVAEKGRLVERLTSRMPTATARDILLLRNLVTQALPAGDAIWAALRMWAARNQFAQAEDGTLLSAIDDALSTDAAIQTWRESLLVGVSEASRSSFSPFPAAFWRWADARPATLTALFDHLSADHDLDARLAQAAPIRLHQAAGDVVMALALAKGYMGLHGAAASLTLTPQEAIERQLSVDSDPANMDGLRAALRLATSVQVLDAALATADPRVLAIAGEKVAQEPSLLRDCDFRDLPVQQVWAQALTLNAEAWQGPDHPWQAFTIVIDNLLDGKPANLSLINALSSSPVADLSDYARRADVWGRVAGTARDNLLRATAAGWLKRVASAAVPYAPDRELESVLLDGDVVDRALRPLLQTDLGAAVRIISALPAYTETRFERLLGELAASRRAISISDAETLGRLMLERHWRRAVDDTIYHVRAGRDDLKPALRICHSMVEILTRWSLGLSPISRDEKWQVLEELAANLYPNGPDDSELWSRALGENADLQRYGSGRSRWRDAITQMRRGKGPRLSALLSEMSRDFPLNDGIRYLAAAGNFGSGYY